MITTSTSITSSKIVSKVHRKEKTVFEKKLQESEDRYKLLFEMSQDPILLLDLSTGTFVEFNPAALRSLDLKEGDFEHGIKPFELSPENQPDGQLSSEKAEMMIQVACKKGYHRFEWLHKALSGRLFYVEVSLTLIPIDDNEYLFTQWRNIDAYKKTLKELEKAKEIAIESDRLKTIFLANMSHELRTPLNSVIGFSNLILENEIDSEDRHYASIINNNGEQLLRIIEDLFDISMIEDGRLAVNRQNIVLNSDFFASIYMTVKTEIEKMNKTELKVYFVPDPNALGFTLKTDRFRLMQVLLNLLRNSIKFTYSGSVVFGYRVLDERVVFYVEDTGIGIPEKMIKQIVEPFRQVSEQYTMNHGGVGLGLSLCDKIVRHLEGELTIKSEVEKGTYIEFWLPKEVDLKTESNTELPKDLNALLTGRRVLIAEDERDNYYLLKTYLEKFGAVCIRAADGIEAVHKYNENQNVDIVLMDIKMPRMDGFSAFRQIRKINSQVKVVATTAFAMSGDEQKVFDMGFDDYLSKPIDLKRLEKMLFKVILS